MTDEKKPKLMFQTESLPGFTVDVPYELWLQVDGATQPVTFEIESGQFPAGISLSSQGYVSGIPLPDARGATVFITVSDATGASETQAFDCEVSEPDGEGS
ncbi:MAG TPA: putative Ig domain-containing protein [Pyrinomonadaceae bacterium]